MNHPKLDYVNGVALLLPEIEDILDKARLSRKERAVLTSIAYLLKSIPPLREDVDNIKENLKTANLVLIRQDIDTLKDNDWFGLIKKYPKVSILIVFIMYLFLISPVREAVLQFLGEILEVALKLV